MPLPLMLSLALATSAVPASAFTGTIVSTYPDGRTAMLWLDADGDYHAVGRRRRPSSGRWSVKGEQVCLKQTKPFGAPFGYCTAMPSGTSWTAKAVTGEAIKVRLDPGR